MVSARAAALLPLLRPSLRDSAVHVARSRGLYGRRSNYEARIPPRQLVARCTRIARMGSKLVAVTAGMPARLAR